MNNNICKFIPTSISGNINVSRFIFETDMQTMCIPYTLTCFRMVLIVEGDGIFDFDGKENDFNKGTLLFGFNGENMILKCGNNCKYMYIDFEGLRAEELLKRFQITSHNRVFRGFEGLIPLWLESLSHASEKTIDLAAESIMLYTFSRFKTDYSKQDTVINRLLQLTEEMFNNTELSLSVIAGELGYNEKYLSHLFKKKMSVSYSEYLRNLRIKYAVNLFENGIDSVKSVALLSGYNDPLYFSSVFKKEIGVSPKEYVTKINEKTSDFNG